MYNRESAGQITEEVRAQVAGQEERIVLTEDQAELGSADCVLLLLSKGVLSPPTLQQLDKVLALDKASGNDRLVGAYSEEGGVGGRHQDQGQEPVRWFWIDIERADGFMQVGLDGGPEATWRQERPLVGRNQVWRELKEMEAVGGKKL